MVEKKVSTNSSDKSIEKKVSPRKKTSVSDVKVETVKRRSSVASSKSEVVSDLSVALKTLKSDDVVSVGKIKKEKPVKDSLGRVYSTGKRKTSVARVWIKAGSGKIVVNKKGYEEYFRRPVLQMIVNQPFSIVNRVGSYDVMATIQGGGLSGQAGALKHGISKALSLFEPELRPLLKKAGFLTRDSRVVERKHYGHKKARRSFQFSKR